MSLASKVPARPPARAVPWRAALLLLVTGVVLFGVLMGLGWLLTRTEPGTAAGELDVGFVRWLARLRTPDLDAVSGVLTDLAATTTVMGLGLATAVVASAVLRRWWPALLMAVAIGGELALFLSSATLVGRPRPPVAPVGGMLPPTSSFPSGHTAAAICLYGGIAAIVLIAGSVWWGRALLVLAVVAVLAVALSRLYRGAHHPTDVLASVLFAGTWLFVTVRTVTPAGPRSG